MPSFLPQISPMAADGLGIGGWPCPDWLSTLGSPHWALRSLLFHDRGRVLAIADCRDEPPDSPLSSVISVSWHRLTLRATTRRLAVG